MASSADFSSLDISHSENVMSMLKWLESRGMYKAMCALEKETGVFLRVLKPTKGTIDEKEKEIAFIRELALEGEWSTLLQVLRVAFDAASTSALAVLEAGGEEERDKRNFELQRKQEGSTVPVVFGVPYAWQRVAFAIQQQRYFETLIDTASTSEERLDSKVDTTAAQDIICILRELKTLTRGSKLADHYRIYEHPYSKQALAEAGNLPGSDEAHAVSIFSSICACLTLSSMADHTLAGYRNWDVNRGRYLVWRIILRVMLEILSITNSEDREKYSPKSAFLKDTSVSLENEKLFRNLVDSDDASSTDGIDEEPLAAPLHLTGKWGGVKSLEEDLEDDNFKGSCIAYENEGKNTISDHTTKINEELSQSINSVHESETLSNDGDNDEGMVVVEHSSSAQIKGDKFVTNYGNKLKQSDSPNIAPLKGRLEDLLEKLGVSKVEIRGKTPNVALPSTSSFIDADVITPGRVRRELDEAARDWQQQSRPSSAFNSPEDSGSDDYVKGQEAFQNQGVNTNHADENENEVEGDNGEIAFTSHDQQGMRVESISSFESKADQLNEGVFEDHNAPQKGNSGEVSPADALQSEIENREFTVLNDNFVSDSDSETCDEDNSEDVTSKTADMPAENGNIIDSVSLKDQNAEPHLENELDPKLSSFNDVQQSGDETDEEFKISSKLNITSESSETSYEGKIEGAKPKSSSFTLCSLDLIPDAKGPVRTMAFAPPAYPQRGNNPSPDITESNIACDVKRSGRWLAVGTNACAIHLCAVPSWSSLMESAQPIPKEFQSQSSSLEETSTFSRVVFDFSVKSAQKHHVSSIFSVATHSLDHYPVNPMFTQASGSIPTDNSSQNGALSSTTALLGSPSVTGLLACSSNHPVIKVSILRSRHSGRPGSPAAPSSVEIRAQSLLPSLCEHALLCGHSGTVRALVWQPRAEPYLYSGGAGDFSIRLWDITRAKFAQPTTLNAVRAKGDTSVAADTLSLRGPLTREADACVRVLQGHTAAIFDLAVCDSSPSLLLSGGQDKRVHLWDIRVAASFGGIIRPQATVVATAPVSSVQLGGGGARVYCGTTDGCVSSWDLRQTLLSSSSSSSISNDLRSTADHDSYSTDAFCKQICDGDVRALSLSPSGEKLICGAFDGTVVELDSFTGEKLRDYCSALSTKTDYGDDIDKQEQRITRTLWHPRHDLWNGFALSTASGKVSLHWLE